MKIRTLIVDDEQLARDRLRAFIKSESTIELIGECSSGTEAIATIRRDAPDLVFLDMQMPGCDGLQVLAEFAPEKRPAVIFATAHEEFAVDAFDVAAVDYLLKPFDRERFQQAVRRAHDYLRRNREASPAPAAPTVEKNERITVKTDGRLVFLQPAEIIRVEAADNYVMLHLATGRLMVRETMTALETRLGSIHFARVNRSAIVRRDQIREIQPAQHGDYTVLLRDGTQLPLSRTLRSQLNRFTSGT